MYLDCFLASVLMFCFKPYFQYNLPVSPNSDVPIIDFVSSLAIVSLVFFLVFDSILQNNPSVCFKRYLRPERSLVRFPFPLVSPSSSFANFQCWSNNHSSVPQSRFFSPKIILPFPSNNIFENDLFRLGFRFLWFPRLLQSVVFASSALLCSTLCVSSSLYLASKIIIINNSILPFSGHDVARTALNNNPALCNTNAQPIPMMLCGAVRKLGHPYR